jgi:hypothetical protein
LLQQEVGLLLLLTQSFLISSSGSTGCEQHDTDDDEEQSNQKSDDRHQEEESEQEKNHSKEDPNDTGHTQRLTETGLLETEAGGVRRIGPIIHANQSGPSGGETPS